MPPVKHALLSASSASRWLVCTAAPRFEEGLPESTSEYAEEGRLAHAIGELKVTKKCTPMSTRTYNTRLNKLKKDPLYTPEMDKTTDLYLEHITEQVMAYDTAPTVAVEVQVDFSDYVPEGFGTCDCCIIGGDLLSIVDYKHGKGVPVSAVGNPQMRLYALGALHRYAPVFGDTIKRVRMTIDQPRLDSYTTDEITVEELRAWGESIKPIAQKAFSGLGEFVPGDHCRFCRGKAQCRARANINTALEDFKDCVPAGSIPADALVPQEHSHTGALTGEEIHPLLSDEEIGALLYKSSIASQTYDKIKLSYENKDTGKREIFVAQDSSNINQWGVLQYYEKLDSTTNAKAMADALLSLYNTKTRTLKLQDVLGDIRVRAGTLLVVMLGLGDINVSNYLMVEQVKHTFNNEQHLMELKMRGGTFVT